jgi:hypothetical protein
MADKAKLNWLEELMLDAAGKPSAAARLHRWEEEPTPDLLASLGEGAEDYLALRAFKLATRRCEHNPSGPACEACALVEDRKLQERARAMDARKAKA